MEPVQPNLAQLWAQPEPDLDDALSHSTHHSLAAASVYSHAIRRQREAIERHNRDVFARHHQDWMRRQRANPQPARPAQEVTRQNKVFFLTYPQASWDVLGFATYIPGITDRPGLEYVASEEKHRDGSDHRHVLLRFVNKIRWNTRTFDFEYQGRNYHPHIQCPVKDINKVYNYVVKDGVFRKVGLDDIAANSQKTCLRLLTDPLEDIIRNNAVSAVNLHKLVQSRHIAAGILQKSYVTDHVKGIWIWGNPGLGKSYFAKRELPQILGSTKEKIYEQLSHVWFDCYENHEIIMKEDLNNMTKGWVDWLMTVGDAEAKLVQVKGGSTSLNHKFAVVTSNFSLRTLLEQLEESPDKFNFSFPAVTRRWRMIRFSHWRKFELQFSDKFDIFDGSQDTDFVWMALTQFLIDNPDRKA